MVKKMSKLIYKELLTERLVLRYPKKSDYQAEFEFLSNKDNFPYADYFIAKHMDDVRSYFQRMLKNQLDTSLFWMISLKDTLEPIGTLSAWNVDFSEMTIEFGYSLFPKYRGKGYMQEAIKVAISFLKKSNHFYKFDIWTDSNNTESLKLPKKLGFCYTGDCIEKAHYSDQDIIYKTFRLIIEEE